MPATFDLLSDCGDPAKIKVLYVAPESKDSFVPPIFRSLNIEHVSPSLLMQTEISRSTSLGAAAQRESRQGKPWSDSTVLAVMRKWFWSRKPDAGFLVTGFPATLLQAKVFEEWLETRDESLNQVFYPELTPLNEVIAHYRQQGLSVRALSSEFLR